MFKECFKKPVLLFVMVPLLLAGVIGIVGVENAYAHACGVCDACINCQPCEELNCSINPNNSGTSETLVTISGSGFAVSSPVRIDFGTTTGITSCVSTPEGNFETTFTTTPAQPGPTTVVACCECAECQAGMFCSSQECGTIFTYIISYPTVSEWGLIVLAVLLLAAGATVIVRRRQRLTA
ncbi:MAG: IPTL-CTERM sorting domain-containing protein [Phycisphaerae bacterium]|jgi:hypothetical protein